MRTLAQRDPRQKQRTGWAAIRDAEGRRGRSEHEGGEGNVDLGAAAVTRAEKETWAPTRDLGGAATRVERRQRRHEESAEIGEVMTVMSGRAGTQAHSEKNFAGESDRVL